MSLTLGLGLGLTSILSAFGAGLVLSGLKGRDGNQPKGLFHDRSDGTIFLFDGDVLIDASPSARALLSGVNIPSSAWSKVSGKDIPWLSADGVPG